MPLAEICPAMSGAAMVSAAVALGMDWRNRRTKLIDCHDHEFKSAVPRCFRWNGSSIGAVSGRYL
jgi:hypothetical protein